MHIRSNYTMYEHILIGEVRYSQGMPLSNVNTLSGHEYTVPFDPGMARDYTCIGGPGLSHQSESSWLMCPLPQPSTVRSGHLRRVLKIRGDVRDARISAFL